MAAAKSETTAPAEGKAGTAAPMAAAPAAKGGMAAMMPVILAVVLAPAATWAVATFVLVPNLVKKLSAAPVEAAAEEHAAEPEKGHAKEGGHGKEGKEGGKEGGPNYEFSNVVVNLAGTMGTRYLKTTFLVTGADKNIKSIFDGNKPQLMDVTLNVLSSLTLADLEEPGAKNVIREKLVGAYNQALKKKVAEQVYFSDFVVQ